MSAHQWIASADSQYCARCGESRLHPEGLCIDAEAERADFEESIKQRTMAQYPPSQADRGAYYMQHHFGQLLRRCEEHPFWYADQTVTDRFSSWLDAKRATPASTTTEPVHLVRFDGETAWRDATEEAYHTFSEKNRRILYSAPTHTTAEDVRDADSKATRDVLAERQRQISAEGWTPEGDDEYKSGQMAVAAGYYALACGYPHERDIGHGQVPRYWPWAANWWKPRDNRSNLVRSGALVLAEIERIDRAAIAAAAESGGVKL